MTRRRHLVVPGVLVTFIALAWSASLLAEPPLVDEPVKPTSSAPPELPPVVSVGGVSLPGVPSGVAQAAAEAGAAARRAQESPTDTAEPAALIDNAQSGATLTVTPGTTELVRIARGYLNQIVTPFRSPKLLTVNSVEVKQEGASLFVATSSMQPVGVHILSNDAADTRAISLTLIPARIPPRTISLQWQWGEAASRAAAPLDDATARHWEESAPYEMQLLELVKLTARGHVPEGYALSEPREQLPCVLPQVTFFTGQKLTGHHFSVFVVRATNTGKAAIELRSHAGCNVPGVRLVAPWPDAYLEPQASTELYVVVSNNEDQDGGSGGVLRPSLLSR